ncbi:MAG: hypothetical protein ACRCYR_10590 [Phycicoccus sp.]
MTARRLALVMVALLAVVAVTTGCSHRDARRYQREQRSIEAREAQESRKAQAEADRPAREAAETAALAALQPYVAARNRALAHAGDPAYDRVSAAAVGSALRDHRAEVGAMSTRGVHQIGESRIETAVISVVSLKGLLDQPRRVVLGVCLDRTDVGHLDAAGMAAPLIDGSPYQALDVAVENATYPSPDGWRVASVDTSTLQLLTADDRPCS